MAVSHAFPLIGLVTLGGAMLTPIAAIELDRARFRRWPVLHPETGLPSFLIMLALLFALATVTRSWEQPPVVSGAIVPLSGTVWLAWFRWRRGRQPR